MCVRRQIHGFAVPWRPGLQGCRSPEPALQASLRRRLRLGHDPTAQTGLWHLALAPKIIMGLTYADQVVRPWASGALWSNHACRIETCADHPAGACLTDGRDSVRVRRCRNGYKTTITATACSCGLVGFVVILRPPTDSRLVRLHAVPAVERKTTVHTPLGSGPGRSPRPGCEICG